ncbi:MAG TPA: hypothetical protein VHJ38_00550 [Nitrososphaeraceae archaeon]|jgi:hypothetical protein|nr:hypothetical protein [Nitrososphaeraceae archaeon]
MKAAEPILLFVVLSLSFIVIAPLSIGSSYALKDEDGVYGIVTIDNVKEKSLEVTAYIYDEYKSKKIKGSPGPIDETATQVKHTFKFDNDDLPQDVGPGTQWIACIEFKSGKGEPSCWTDTFNSNSQPDRITLDADYIRD